MSHFARSTLIVAVFFGLEKLLGFVRQLLIARQFGLSTELDAFNAANNLPDLLFALISGGALAMALIPVLSEYLNQKGRSDAWELFSRIANLVFLTTAALSVIIALLADHIVGWQVGIAPGFTPDQQALVSDLMRLNLIATLFFSTGGMLIAALQANQHFLLPALAPSMYDLGMLFGILVLAPQTPYQIGPVTIPTLGLGVYGLVYGVILGAALFVLVQVPGLVRYRFRWTPKIDLRNPGLQRILRLMGPRIATVFFIQMVFLAQDNLASRLVAGSVTVLVYGWLFMQVPESLIGTAIGAVLLPTLSEKASANDTIGYRRAYLHTIRLQRLGCMDCARLHARIGRSFHLGGLGARFLLAPGCPDAHAGVGIDHAHLRAHRNFPLPCDGRNRHRSGKFTGIHRRGVVPVVVAQPASQRTFPGPPDTVAHPAGQPGGWGAGVMGNATAL
jgi:putative peptidoglycan lipid II flippase